MSKILKIKQWKEYKKQVNIFKSLEEVSISAVLSFLDKYFKIDKEPHKFRYVLYKNTSLSNCEYYYISEIGGRVRIEWEPQCFVYYSIDTNSEEIQNTIQSLSNFFGSPVGHILINWIKTKIVKYENTKN